MANALCAELNTNPRGIAFYVHVAQMVGNEELTAPRSKLQLTDVPMKGMKATRAVT